MSFTRCGRFRVGTLLMLLLALEGDCRVWIEKPLRPDTSIGVGRHRFVRVITNDGDTVTMRAVAFINDSIAGLDTRLDRRVAIARDNVQAVEVRMDGTPTWVRIGWKIYLAVLFALYAWLAIVTVQLGMAERSG
ncbi:MAG TPA: hypothetical protein VF858_13440 [Gemmatimonadaceae bacterium]